MGNIVVKARTSVVIHSWMINDLGLHGNDLLCYAMIYSACQDGNTKFGGSRKYIASWLGCSMPTVDAVLIRLCEQNLIHKNQTNVNGVIINNYELGATFYDEELQETIGVVKKFYTPSKNFTPPQNSLHNTNIIDTNNNNNNNDDIINLNNTTTNNTKIKEKEKSHKKEKEKSDLFEQCWIAYNRKGSKKKAKDYWHKLSDKEKDNVMQHIKVYVTTREKKYQKDFERYLRDKTFNDLIIQGDNIIYDPNNDNDKTYHPITGGALNWNDYYKCYLYTAWYFPNQKIYDGYDDDKRPDGAKIVLNNGRGTLIWNKEQQKWIKQ